MASFMIEVDGNQYEMEFTRDSVRLFENLGGSVSELRSKMFNSIDLLFYTGLHIHNPDVNPNLAKKISDTAIEEFGIEEVFETVSEPFAEVFMLAGKKPAGKSLRLVPKKKPATKTE